MSKLITVNYNQKPCYNIVIENDFSKLAENVTKLEISGRKLAVITDSNVGPLYADKVAQCLKETGNNIFVYTFEAGEKNKNLNTVQDVYEFLIKSMPRRYVAAANPVRSPTTPPPRATSISSRH